MMFAPMPGPFAFWGLALRRAGIYDSMKPAMDAMSSARRKFNGRIAQMCSHSWEPTACTPAAGWEKGQVENQVGSLPSACSFRARREDAGAEPAAGGRLHRLRSGEPPSRRP